MLRAYHNGPLTSGVTGKLGLTENIIPNAVTMLKEKKAPEGLTTAIRDLAQK